jgi:hypothetical protein
MADNENGRNGNRKDRQSQFGTRQPLILYRLIARRYRPVGILLFLMGVVALLPLFIAELRGGIQLLTFETLAVLGFVSLLTGAVLTITSIFRERRAYVQCMPHFFLINTAGKRVAIAYQRIQQVRTVKVGTVFPKDTLKGRDLTLVKQMIGDLGLEIVLNDFPLPQREMRRRLHKLLISPRETGLIIVVPVPQQLSIELETFQSRAREQAAEKARYLDPIERMRFQEPSKLR